MRDHEQPLREPKATRQLRIQPPLHAHGIGRCVSQHSNHLLSRVTSSMPRRRAGGLRASPYSGFPKLRMGPRPTLATSRTISYPRRRPGHLVNRSRGYRDGSDHDDHDHPAHPHRVQRGCEDASRLQPAAGADDAPRGVHDRMSAAGPGVLLPSQRAPVRASRHPRPGRQRAGDVEHQRANPQVPLAPRSRVDPPGPEPVLRAVHVRRHSAVLRPQQDAPAARRDVERSGRHRGRALCEGRACAAVHARLRPVAGVHQPLRTEGSYHSGRRRAALRHVSARRHERGGPHEHLRRGVRVAGVHRPPGGVRPRERSRERPDAPPRDVRLRPRRAGTS